MKTILVYGNNKNLENIAINKIKNLYKEKRLSLSIVNSNEFDLKNNDFDVIYLIGTNNNNLLINDLYKNNFFKKCNETEGFTYKINKNPYNNNQKLILINGNDYHGTLYGVVEFIKYYVNEALDIHTSLLFCKDYFIDNLYVEKEYSSYPKIKQRSIWTWGHVIYNYKKFIDNMVDLKLNTIIMWNDYLPSNYHKFAKYAHKNGIKVYCGYEWGWRVKHDEVDLNDVTPIKQNIIKNFESTYNRNDIDGIYFQSFTETENDNIRGIDIASKVIEVVNDVSLYIFKNYGNVDLIFGLHATSVKEKLDIISKTNKNVTIMWEDCGAFPYAYNSKYTYNFNDTLNFNKKINKLRGKNEKFGACLKGMMNIDWSKFSFQSDVITMQLLNNKKLKELFDYRYTLNKSINANWLQNFDYAKQLIYDIYNNTHGFTHLSLLAEDGVIEYKIPLCLALFSELLWDFDEKNENIINKVAKRDDVYL